MITIFTDGSSRGNPGPGGWGSVVIDDGKVAELGGGEKNTTNNRMELMAAVKGLEHIPKGSVATVFTDSSYVINGITKWIHGWRRNDWQTKAKEDVLNKDLWMELSEETSTREVKWKYVGGHVGILGNERCDHIATAFADGRDVKLYKGSLAGYDLPDILDVSFDELKAKSKKSDSSRSRAKAYSYISVVGGVIEVHHSWAECEKRVKGVRGARFKKSISAEDEAMILEEFSTI
jgi:ribonuclease HI